MRLVLGLQRAQGMGVGKPSRGGWIFRAWITIRNF